MRPATTTITSTAALVAWMHDLYLSELVLLSCKPAPKASGPRRRAPAKVTLELGLPDHAYAGARDRFEVFTLVATGVTRWELEGDHALDDDAELTFESSHGVDAPVTTRVRAEGVALLACASVEAGRGGERFRKAKPRPWRHGFTMWSDDVALTVAALLEVAAVPGAVLSSYDEPPLRADAAWPLASLEKRTPRAFSIRDGAHDRAREIASVAPVFRHEPGWTLGIQRSDGATDDEWDRLWRFPVALSASRVSSRTLTTDAAGWARVDWRSGAK